MSDLSKRLDRLEAQRTNDGYCVCQNAWAFVDYRDGIEEAGGERPAPICPACGLPKRIIEVHLTTFAYGEHGRRELPTDASGRAVFDYDAAIACLAPDPDGE